MPTGRLRDTQVLESALGVALNTKDYVQAAKIQQLLQAGNDVIAHRDLILKCVLTSVVTVLVLICLCIFWSDLSAWVLCNLTQCGGCAVSVI